MDRGQRRALSPGRPQSPLGRLTSPSEPSRPSYGTQPQSLPNSGCFSSRPYSGASPTSPLGGPSLARSPPAFATAYDAYNDPAVAFNQQQVQLPSTFQQRPPVLSRRRSSLGLPNSPYARPDQQDASQLARIQAQQHGAQQQHIIHRAATISPPARGEYEDDGDRRRGARELPDCCAVCGNTQTPEWRRGPAGARSLCNGCGLMAAKRAKERDRAGEPQPITMANIVRELQGIGEERFKAASGEYQLPPNTPARIMAAQARTRAQEHGSANAQARPNRRGSRGVSDTPEGQAAASLVTMRRSSLSQQSPPAAQSTFGGRTTSSAQGPTIYSAPRGRRANSLASPTSSAPLSTTGPSSGYSFGATSSHPQPRAAAATPSSAHRALSPGRLQSQFGSARLPPPPSNRMNLNFITNPQPATMSPPPPGLSRALSDMRTRRSPSPTGARQRRLSMSELQPSLEERMSQQYL